MGYVITQLHGTAKEYVVMIAAYGIIDHTLNYAQQTMNSYKNQTNIQWLCCKCESINVTTFTFHSYELDTSNYYDTLTHNSTFESVTSNEFSPLKASSPKTNNSHTTTSKMNTSKNRSNSSNVFNLPTKRNLRIFTVNCRSIKDKTF